MGTGRGQPKANSKSKKKWFKKNVMDLKRHGKYIDQIQDEMMALADGRATLDKYKGEDRTGGGAFFCVPCSRDFMNEHHQKEHMRGKPHKKRVKEVAEPQYTQKEANLGAGMSS